MIVKNQGESFVFEKGVIAYKKTPKAPITDTWDAGKEVREADIDDLKIMCTWFDSDNPDVKGSYKLPHHRKSGYVLVWRAVAAAMGALLGARGGVDIPSGDRRGVYNHLSKHYKEFDKRVPLLKSYTKEELEKIEQDDFQNKNKDEVKKMDELIKVLKDITGIELSKKQIDAIKTLSEEEVKEFNGALEVIGSYKDELPEELNEKFASITKFTIKEQPDPKSPEITEEQKTEILKEFEKTGKKLSKDTIDIIEGAVKKLSSITEVVEALSRLLPEGKKEGTKKGVSKGEEDKMTVNLSFDDIGLKEGLDKMGKDIKDSFEKALVERDKKIEGLDKKLEGVDELSKRIKTLEEVKGVKKGLEEEEEGAKKKDVKWPSFETDEE